MPHTILDKAMAEMLDAYEQRLESGLASLRKLIMTNIYRAKQLVNEQQISNGKNSVQITSPQSRNTEVITNVFINVDHTVGGTMVLTLGNTVLNYATLPPDDIEEINQANFVLRPNDVRQVVVTPGSGACKYLNLYLQGYEVGDTGSIA